MKLLEKYNEIKLKNEGHVLLFKSGAFYISLGIDAYILNEILKLKLTNFSNMKKVGIPVGSVKKYISIMQDFDIPYVIAEDENVVYSYNGCFDFVYKTENINMLLGVWNTKDKILKLIYNHFSKNLGEML